MAFSLVLFLFLASLGGVVFWSKQDVSRNRCEHEFAFNFDPSIQLPSMPFPVHQWMQGWFRLALKASSAAHVHGLAPAWKKWRREVWVLENGNIPLLELEYYCMCFSFFEHRREKAQTLLVPGWDSHSLIELLFLLVFFFYCMYWEMSRLHTHINYNIYIYSIYIYIYIYLFIFIYIYACILCTCVDRTICIAALVG